MTLEEIYFISGIVTGLGVIVSLVFVGVQLRNQNKEARLASGHAIAHEMRSLTLATRDDPEFARIFNHAIESGFDGLDPVEATRVASQLGAFTRLYEEAFNHRNEDLLDQGLWRSVERTLGAMVRSKGGREYWAARQMQFSELFVDYIGDMEGIAPFETFSDAINKTFANAANSESKNRS
jgi:hypothetical protein